MKSLLLNSNGSVKIAYFGRAKLMRDGHVVETSCGSRNYAFIEVIPECQFESPKLMSGLVELLYILFYVEVFQLMMIIFLDYMQR
ncbi:hypothetical protein LXL04_025069 [Taraxacum kok-saghyz]